MTIMSVMLLSMKMMEAMMRRVGASSVRVRVETSVLSAVAMNMSRACQAG